jgi:hypothetical protein
MNFVDFKKKYCEGTPMVTNLEPKIQGWNSRSVALKQAIEQANPESIVEVGSWLGASALFMAEQSKAQIICVDTFLGSNEVLWRNGDVKDVTKNFSQVYDQFCANITYSNANSQISPLPMGDAARPIVMFLRRDQKKYIPNLHILVSCQTFISPI